MAEPTMFSDRRASADRRKQQLPMPAGQNRRKDCRRDRNFHSKPWWLVVDYSVELISEKECAEQLSTVCIDKLPEDDRDMKPRKHNK